MLKIIDLGIQLLGGANLLSNFSAETLNELGVDLVQRVPHLIAADAETLRQSLLGGTGTVRREVGGREDLVPVGPASILTPSLHSPPRVGDDRLSPLLHEDFFRSLVCRRLKGSFLLADQGGDTHHLTVKGLLSRSPLRSMIGQESRQNGQKKRPETTPQGIGAANPIAMEELQEKLLGEVLRLVDGISLRPNKTEHRSPVAGNALVHRLPMVRPIVILGSPDQIPGGRWKPFERAKIHAAPEPNANFLTRHRSGDYHPSVWRKEPQAFETR